MWLREHARVYSAGSPVDTGEIALYKNYSLLLLLLSDRVKQVTGLTRPGKASLWSDQTRGKQVPGLTRPGEASPWSDQTGGSKSLI